MFNKIVLSLVNIAYVPIKLSLNIKQQQQGVNKGPEG